MTTAGRDESAPDALSHAQVEPVTQRQRRRLRRYGNEPRAPKPYVRKQRGHWGQKLAGKPASPWQGNLSPGDLIIVRQAVRRGSVPRERRPAIVKAVCRTAFTGTFRPFMSAARVLITMHGEDISATTSLKD